MSDLKSIDIKKLEKFLEMGSGYVCDFSDRTFGNFVIETVGIDVYTDEYSKGGTSKANRLRTFWKKESNNLTVKLLKEILEYWRVQKLTSKKGITQSEQALYEESIKVIKRLEEQSSIEDVEAFRPNSNNKDFTSLANSIRESIKKNEPNQALDRLHTFVTKYMRALCDKYSIAYDKDTPLHSLFGGYMKFLQQNNLLESNMSERILKSSISVLDAFNSVRNNQSLAHDNPVLNHNESVLIFNNISNTLRFIEFIEKKISEQKKKKVKDGVDWKDLEFSKEEIEAAGDVWIQQQSDIARGK